MRHELHLARAGFAALAAIAALSALVAGVVGGLHGVQSAAIGVALVAGNHALAVASTAWARTLVPRVIAVGYSVFVVRMMLMLSVLVSLQGVAWIDGPVLAGAFCAALVASLTAECISYARGSYVPSWRLTR
jgi:hypothetical protein